MSHVYSRFMATTVPVMTSCVAKDVMPAAFKMSPTRKTGQLGSVAGFQMHDCMYCELIPPMAVLVNFLLNLGKKMLFLTKMVKLTTPGSWFTAPSVCDHECM